MKILRYITNINITIFCEVALKHYCKKCTKKPTTFDLVISTQYDLRYLTKHY